MAWLWKQCSPTDHRHCNIYTDAGRLEQTDVKGKSLFWQPCSLLRDVPIALLYWRGKKLYLILMVSTLELLYDWMSAVTLKYIYIKQTIYS